MMYFMREKTVFLGWFGKRDWGREKGLTRLRQGYGAASDWGLVVRLDDFGFRA